MADLLGRNSVIYYGAVNTTPSTLLTNFRKPKASNTKTIADNTRHASTTKSGRPVRNEKSIEFEMIDDEATDVVAFRGYFNNDTPIAIKALNKAGGVGLLGDFYVTQFETDQDEENLQIISVKLEPTVEYRDVAAV